MPFAEDPQVFVADFGVPCVFGAYTFLALLDQPDNTLLMEPAHIQTREYSLRYISAQAVLTRGQTGTVNGVAYKVRDVAQAVGDGVFSTLVLSKV